ncbi:MAG: GntR family transcriptional regulator [Chloroflexi bacterium]|nr:GntR family transcriptional regulator [Chloroflexota bacterium]
MEKEIIIFDSFTPLYEQVRLRLMERITAGEWDDGSPLPSENELSEHYGVSRITIRRAISEIVRGDFVYRKQGKGTFVKPRDAYYLLGGAQDFPKNAQALGKKARSEVIGFDWIPADETLAARLGLPTGERVLFIKMIRYLDDEVVGWQTIHVAPEIGELVDVETLEARQTLNPLLRVKGRQVAEVLAVQGARLAEERDIALLGCSPNTPVLYSIYTEYGMEGKCYSYAEVAFRADKFKWVFRVVGPQA